MSDFALYETDKKRIAIKNFFIVNPLISKTINIQTRKMRFYLLITGFILYTTTLVLGQTGVLGEAESLYKQGQYQQSIQKYELALIEEPNSAYIKGQIGFANLFLEKYENAKSYFTEAIELDPTVADYYNARGLAEAYLGNVNDAINDFTIAIEKDSKFAQAYLNRGSAYSSIGDTENSIQDLKVAETLDKKNPEINYQLGRLYSLKNDFKSSIKNYKVALNKGLDSEQILMSLALSYFKNNEFQKAANTYTQVIKRNPQNTDALNNRAVSYDKLGKKDLAEKDRNELYSITGVEFKDPNDYKFNRVDSKDGNFHLNLPSHWIVEKQVKDGEDKIIVTIPQKDKNPRFQAVKLTLSYNYNMQDNYGVGDPNGLVSFWQSSQLKNTETYVKYDLLSQKKFSLNGWSATRFLTLSQPTHNSPIFKMYELVTSKPDKLFYGYFQSSAQDFEFFYPTFDKIIESINFTN